MSVSDSEKDTTLAGLALHLLDHSKQLHNSHQNVADLARAFNEMQSQINKFVMDTLSRLDTLTVKIEDLEVAVFKKLQNGKDSKFN